MWIQNKIFCEDMEYIANVSFIPWDKVEGKTILITGGTGLIGSTVISSLIYANEKRNLNLRIIALVRNEEKAKKMFSEQLKFSNTLQFVVGTVEQLPSIEEDIDYIIHGASPTASDFFVEYPIETIMINVKGTENLLRLAKEKKVDSFLYLSSMEVYGAPSTDQIINESQGTTLDTMSVRSCYPEAKRLCENLCASYSSEYHVPTNVIRLAQTFGPGVVKNDKRVFAEFARCAIQHKDIVLQTPGESKRCYLYTADAATAILAVLLSDALGEAYNAANSSTYCSIAEMAQMVVKYLAHNNINIKFNINNENKKKFPPSHHLNLSTEKITMLGWKPSRGLREMYARMIEGME